MILERVADAIDDAEIQVSKWWRCAAPHCDHGTYSASANNTWLATGFPLAIGESR